MSAPPPDEPPARPEPTPPQGEPTPPGDDLGQPRSEPRRTGGSLILGIVVGVLILAALVGLNILLAPVAPWFAGSYLLVPILYIVVAILLSVGLRTARFGSGLLIAFGIAILVSAGVCVALINGIGRPQ